MGFDKLLNLIEIKAFDYKKNLEIVDDFVKNKLENSDVSIKIVKKLIELAGINEDIERKIALLFKIADFYYIENDSVESFGYFRSLINECETNNIFYKYGYSLNCIGKLYTDIGEYDEALKVLFKAHDINSEGNDSDLAKTYNLIGNVYWSFKKFDDALEYYQKSYEIRKNLKDESGMASSLNNLGLIYMEKNEAELAATFFLEALFLTEKTDNKAAMSAVLTNLGVTYENNGDLDSAKENFKKTFELNLELGDKNGLAVSYINIASIAKKSKEYTEAKRCLKEAKDISEQNNFVDLSIDIYLALSEIYELTGDFKKSLSYYKIHTELKSKLFEDNKSKKMAELQVKFNYQNKDREAALAKAESEVYRLKNIELDSYVRKLEEANKKLINSQEEIIRLERKNSVLAMIATANHEMSQPLAVLKGNLELFLSSIDKIRLDEKMAKITDRMRNALSKMESILHKYRNKSNQIHFDRYAGETDMVVFEDDIAKSFDDMIEKLHNSSVNEE
ncbi:MAG: tetratricopeptide repeat protein [Candidatus Delongbacteria bacterium]|nr:tetratricopeptide repeat protein [Candidatus Delongbacteria bacterium]MBN2836490.1 tetratricopeptide repeat protein [Candidatus Delongbacteria bacterium]